MKDLFSHDEVMMTSRQRRKLCADRAGRIWGATFAALCAIAMVWVVYSTAMDHKDGNWAFVRLFGLGLAAAIAAIAPAAIYYAKATWHIPPDDDRP